MGKKKAQIKSAQRTSTRMIKKKQPRQDQQEYYEDEPSEQISNQDVSESDSEYSSDNESDQQQSGSQSVPMVDPQNYAVRTMQFRQRRGTKMNYLINRKKQQEQDPFWAQQGQNYFGNLDSGDNDQEDYVQSSSGRDEFDSDFDQTESQHDDQQAAQQKQQLDQDEEKARKKKQELMRKIHAPAPQVKKIAQKTEVSPNKIKKDSQKKVLVTEPTSRYIHEVFNQQELLGEAATTEYFNWLSLKKLISIQTQKKDFTHRSHHIQGPKVIYRNKFTNEGKRQVTYQLSQLQIKNVKDLSNAMKND